LSTSVTSAHDAGPTARRKWLGLAALCAAFFMVILDVAIVNVALPTIQVDLDFSQKNLQWVVSAYALTFGGLLLLGGRIADLIGRRRVFITGVALFSSASLIAGLASTEATLIGARAFQGIGAALMTPAALSILMTTFAEGSERNKALGIWGAVGASGGTVGVLLGGVFTDTIGWEWIFLLNVPVGLAVIASAPFLLRESRAESAHRRFDLAGGVSITASLALLVYALVEASSEGWTSATTIGRLVGSAVLMAIFVVIELRSRAPIMPFSIFRIRAVTGSNVAGFALGGAMFGMFFILTLYMQQVVQYSPLQTGLAYLATSLAAFVASVGGSMLVTRIGPRTPMVAGLLLFALGLSLLAQIPVDGSYVSDLLPGFVITGLGLGLAFVAFSIGALEGVSERDAGLASGLSNTTQQIGGALGVAIMSTLAITRTEDLAAGGTPQPEALTEGFQIALYSGVGLAVAGALAVMALVRSSRSAEAPVETVVAEPASEGSTS
jgi:EmrB/QacA subfamily drug resistance transporter